VERAIAALAEVGLIMYYSVNGRECIAIAGFDKHQSGLHHRTQSEYPPPPNEREAFSASEYDVEAKIVDDLRSGVLCIDGAAIKSVERQVRVGNKYMDVVAETDIGTIVIEVKRQRVTNEAITQVKGYIAMIGGDSVPAVIGHGVSPTVDLTATNTLIGTYNESMQVTTAAPFCVKERSLTFRNVPSEQNRTELKGRELNRTARSADFDRFWSAYPRRVGKDAALAEWNKLRPDNDLVDLIIAKVEEQRASAQWLRDGGAFIPHPRTWLHQGRWKDEPVALPQMGDKTVRTLSAAAEFVRGER